MHELAVCLALVAELEAVARAEGGTVKRARVGVGLLSGVEPDLLSAAFPIACAGSLADGASLEIARIAVRVRCTSCGAGGAAAPNRLICSTCGDWRTEVTDGEELLLTEVEVRRPEVVEAALAAGKGA